MHARFAGFVAALCLLATPALAAITGTVINGDGAPVAGARVTIRAYESSDARRARLLSDAPEAVPLATTQTDAKGAFTLESPKNPVVGLFVSAAGYGPVSTRVERDEDAGAVVLPKAQLRRGTISSGGKPVPNATVAIQYGSYEYVTKTDAEGRYDAPDPKRATALVVLHPDFAIDEKVPFLPAPTERDLTRTLTTGTKVSGRVVAADGQTPVAGATLTIDNWPAGTSGEDGTFTIARAPSRWSSLVARKDGMLAQLPYAKSGAYTLRLQKAATITGRVVDSKSKLPVAGAVVRTAMSRMTRTEGFAAETDAKGAYSIVVPPGAYMVLAAHPAYVPADGDVSAGTGQQVTRDFAATQMARVSGTVMDEEKRPVAVAQVAAEEAADPTERMMRMMRTVNDQVFSGPDGRFSIRVPPDAALIMNAVKRGFPPAKSDQFRVASGDRKTGLVLTIPSGIGVTGRVTDADGNPLSGIAVAAEPAQDGRGAMVFRSVIVGGPQAEDDAVRTGSDGSFSMRLKEGTYDFNFRGEGYAPKTVRGQSVALSAPATVDTTLVPASEITGRVLRGGTAVEGVNVNAFAPGTSASAITAQDGSFTLSGLSAGSLRVMLRKDDDFIQDMRNLTAPSRDVVIDLAAGGRVTGRVVDKSTGKALTSFQAGISLSRGGGGMMMMAPPQLRDFNSEDGSFTLENVPAGAMSLVATAPGYTSSRLNVTVEEGKTLSDVELALDAGVRLTGRVTGPNGAPLADVSVRIQPSPTGAFSLRGTESSAITDTNGEYSLEALPAGEETIAFTHARYLTARREVTLKGRETKLDVQLSAGERVSGIVVTEAGVPVADARVDAFGAGIRGESARTNANGAFEIESLQPGRYRFTASKSGVGEGSVDDVDLSGNQQVRIIMRAGGTIYGRVIGLTPEELALTSVTARSGRSHVAASPDSSGNYRLEGAPTGTVTVTAELAGRADIMSNRTSQRQTVEVAPGGSQNVDLTFRNDITITGRVIRNGKPLPSATVMFFPKRTGTAQTSANTPTNEQGQYTLRGVEEGDYTVEVIDMQRLSPYSTTYTVRGSATFDIDFSTSSIRGTVVDGATNEPVANAGIQVNPATPSDSFRMPRGASTDAQGTFILESVPPGTYSVTTSKDGYGSDTREVMVGDRAEELQVKLSRADDVILRLVDGRDGRAINGMIWVYDAQGRLVYDTMRMFRGLPESDAGQISLPLAPGSYTASISANNYASINITLQSPSAARTIALTPGGKLLLRSKHSRHRYIRLLDANGIAYQRFNNPLPSRDLLPQPGTTQINNIAPGTYTVQLLEGASVVGTVQVRVEEGKTTEAEI